MRFFKMLLLVLLVIAGGCFIYFSLGSEVSDKLDSYVYELPFEKGKSFEVVQGYGGRFSHKNKAAIDFRMPEGTPVHAAREGIVYAYKESIDEGGPFPGNEKKSNYVIIRHADGSFGCYWHLKKSGVVVKKGRVAKGQLIGYSGNTGFTLWPHLHFAVKSKLTYDMNSFVQTKFKTTEGPALLEKGKHYTRPGR